MTGDSDLVLARCAESFNRQGLMRTLGARLRRARDGECVIEVSHSAGVTQQHGYFHAGVTAAIADTSSGYAAFSLMPGEVSVLTVEFKISLLAPAEGELLRATARVIRAGRKLMTVSARVEAILGDRIIHCAEFLGTMAAVRGHREGSSEG